MQRPGGTGGSLCGVGGGAPGTRLEENSRLGQQPGWGLAGWQGWVRNTEQTVVPPRPLLGVGHNNLEQLLVKGPIP